MGILSGVVGGVRDVLLFGGDCSTSRALEFEVVPRQTKAVAESVPRELRARSSGGPVACCRERTKLALKRVRCVYL